MANNSGNGGSGSDTGLIALLLALIFGPILAWFVLQKPVVFLWSWIAYGQTWLLAHLQGWIGGHSVAAEMSVNMPMLNWYLWAHAHPAQVTWHDVAHYSTVLGEYYRWITIAVIAFLAYRNYQTVEIRKNRQSMNDMVIAMKEIYPWGLPWLWQSSEILNKSGSGAFQYALRPWEWVKKLQGHGRPLAYKELDDSPDTICLEDPDRIQSALQDQLKHPMDAYTSWPVWFQALTTACIPQARDSKDTETKNRLGKLARHYYGVKPKKGGDYVPPELKAVPWPVSDKDKEYLAEIGKRHAYRETFFIGLVAEARVRGLLPPSYMAWLRAVDRTLWYALQSLGRPRNFIEGDGVIAHYVAEVKKAKDKVHQAEIEGNELDHFGDDGVAIPEKQVDSAVAGLVFALREEDAGTVRRVENQDLMDWRQS